MKCNISLGFFLGLFGSGITPVRITVTELNAQLMLIDLIRNQIKN
jgi:hypothetical protein